MTAGSRHDEPGMQRQMKKAPLRNDYPIRPIPFTQVTIADSFWKPRLETNRRVTIPYVLQKCAETGRIDNFAKAGGLLDGPFEGLCFNDSDVFKAVEGAARSLARHPDPALDRELDEIIAKIAAAQEEDGYLYTIRTIDPQQVSDMAGPARWANLRFGHELYNAGHLYEAAVAHTQATGKRTLLDVALKNAALIDRVFGPAKKHGAPGHPEIEMGLVKLYRVTGDESYLNLAKFFLHARGRGPMGFTYMQDHEPVVAQREAVGHAVRAAYLYSGLADVAALAGDSDDGNATDRLWQNVVGKKLYLTGGIGASHAGEAFGDNYELPNETAYCETCAAIANAMWNQRLFLRHGDARYIDVLERILYNGFLAGVSLAGDTFFYPNPLASNGRYKFNMKRSATRSPWFDCACCPTNVVRFMPAVPGLIYAHRQNSLYVNLYIGGQAEMEVAGRRVQVSQETGYPWQGHVAITLVPEKPTPFAVYLRLPGWAQNRPVPSDLYRFLATSTDEIGVLVNGEAVPWRAEKGFARVQRTWQPHDTIELHFPMPIRRVLSHEKVAANRGRVALQRGPLVYCVEGIDNNGRIQDLVLADDAPLRATPRPHWLGGIVAIQGQAKPLTAVPYYAWSHRGEGEMAVWLLRDASLAHSLP